VLHDSKSFTKIHNEYNLPWSVFVGIAGLPGKLLLSLFSRHALTVVSRSDRIFRLEGAFACKEGEIVLDVSRRSDSVINFTHRGKWHSSQAGLVQSDRARFFHVVWLY